MLISSALFTADSLPLKLIFLLTYALANLLVIDVWGDNPSAEQVKWLGYQCLLCKTLSR
jgi:hypothetical protein